MPQHLIAQAVKGSFEPARDAHRAHAEALLARAVRLDPADRALIEHVLRDGKRAADLAPLMGVHKRTAQRRVARLLTRLEDPVFLAVWDRLPLLPPALRAVADHHVCRGRTLRDTARRTHQSLHHVRVQVQRLRQFAADAQDHSLHLPLPPDLRDLQDRLR